MMYRLEESNRSVREAALVKRKSVMHAEAVSAAKDLVKMVQFAKQ